jgi:hypothetical protein
VFDLGRQVGDGLFGLRAPTGCVLRHSPFTVFGVEELGLVLLCQPRSATSPLVTGKLNPSMSNSGCETKKKGLSEHGALSLNRKLCTLERLG